MIGKKSKKYPLRIDRRVQRSILEEPAGTRKDEWPIFVLSREEIYRAAKAVGVKNPEVALTESDLDYIAKKFQDALMATLEASPDWMEILREVISGARLVP